MQAWRKIGAAIGFLFVTIPVMAEENPFIDIKPIEPTNTPSTLKANFRRVAIEFANTSVSHAEEYQNSPISEFSADSQMQINGVFDFMLEYQQDRLAWNNGLYMEYGKTKIKKADGERTTNEDADEILVSTDLAQKLWKVQTADLGPFVNLGFQTEFTANQDAPRNKVARLKGGLKLFNGKYLEELYLAMVGESDFTYSPTNYKSAGEIGFRANYPVREGVKFAAEGYFRQYFSYSQYEETDLKYDLNVKARMDVSLTKTLALAPYISYRLGKARGASVTGSNFMIGLSFQYADLFNIF